MELLLAFKIRELLTVKRIGLVKKKEKRKLSVKKSDGKLCRVPTFTRPALLITIRPVDARTFFI